MLLCPALVQAQSFSMMNGRNHPELDWQVATTAHFEIMYPAHLAGIEAEAAPIAETTYEALSQNLDVTFDGPIRIYLSDEDEIVNGFAVPFGNGYTDIWVGMNGVSQGWTGREKWLRKVLAHELAHIFHFQAVRSNIGQLGFALGNGLPRFWTEGLAQYETETWDAYRGDRWLRTAILDDRLSPYDGTSGWNGRLLYASGNAQVRYFAEHYGDSTLTKLLKHRNEYFGGRIRVHDFYDAFEEVTGDSYSRFYDRWRRHLNVYYNTLAGHMEPLDSLDADRLSIPGQYLYDVAYSPDTTQVAVLSMTSLVRPVRRLIVIDRESGKRRTLAEGAVQPPLAWNRASNQIAYARQNRGDHGSIVNDLYLMNVATGKETRLTNTRRVASPTFSPDGQRLAYVATTLGTANVVIRDLVTSEETELTRFTGDVQLSSIRWHPSEEQLVLAKFDADGRRLLTLIDILTGEETELTDGTHDDHRPIWNADGSHLAFTSFRDNVPNTFIMDLATRRVERVTNVVTGTSAHSWMPPDSAHAAGRLVVVAAESKRRERTFRFDARRRVVAPPRPVPQVYQTWTTHRPPNEVPRALAPDTSLITGRSRYNAWANLTHVATFALPYVAAPDDWGLFGFTSWTEPLGKHTLAFAGGLSVTTPRENSVFQAGYINRVFTPTLSLFAYHQPGYSRFYGSDLLFQNVTGGHIAAVWPLDRFSRSYASARLSTRLRFADFNPTNLDDFLMPSDGLPPPESGQKLDAYVAFTYAKQKPYAFNTVHPLDGFGVRLRVSGAAPVLGTDARYLQGTLGLYTVLPSLGTQRFYLYGKAQARTGSTLPQDVLGLSRYDDVQIDLPEASFLFSQTERVRGYRSFAAGDRVLFGTAEYRMLIAPSLETTILGLVSLGATSLTAFADAGLVWTGDDVDNAIRRVGVGAEVKNGLRIAGAFTLSHALGIAQPASDLGGDDYDLYYRIRAAVPFR
ncbi:MAG: PD40 domain-containing protein [Rhodothermales bacterium]